MTHQLAIYLLVFGGLLLLAVLLDDLAERIRMPGVLMVLLLGLLIDNKLGSGSGAAPLLSLHQAQQITEAALVLVLFFGGLTTNWSQVKGVIRPAARLATLGVVFTSVLLAVVMLLFGVGVVEELLFRGWLWRELQMIGSASAMGSQALIFSLVHTRFNLGFWPMLSLLIGLMLLGLCLALQRRLDGGSLWGCIGLHGGLVAGWFLLQSGLLQISPDAPLWLVGPGLGDTNPLGGVIGIMALSGLLMIQLTAVARAARPATGARKAS